MEKIFYDIGQASQYNIKLESIACKLAKNRLREFEKKNSMYRPEIKVKSRNKHKRIAMVMRKYIEENYQNCNLSVELIADLIELSPNYARTIFKYEFNISITDYINYLRFINVLRLLESTEYTYKKIAVMVGLNDTKYIYKIFKKLLGITATNYRKKINAGKGTLNNNLF